MESLEAHLSELHVGALVNQAAFRILVHTILSVAHEKVRQDIKKVVLVRVADSLEFEERLGCRCFGRRCIWNSRPFVLLRVL